MIKIFLQAEIDSGSLNKIKQDINNLSNNTKAKPIKINVDVDGKANERFKDINLELQKLGKFDLGTTPLIKGLEVVGYSVKEAKDGTTKFTQSLNDGKNKIVTYSGEINRASDSYEILGKSTRQATRENQTFLKELGIAIKRTVEWSLAVGGYYKVIREMKNGIQFINETDKSLSEIRMVTGLTTDEVGKLAVEYSNLGKQMGIATNEILKGSVEWFRQGKTMAETADLMRASIMQAKLSGMETAQATEYLTSTLNGFKLEASEATDVVSKMVAIDNIAATSVAELSEALQRSATSSQQAGVELDTLLGYIGTVSSVSRRSASSIGESFKTMFARMQDIKLNKLDEDGIGLSDVENTLNRVGVALRSSETDFRDLSDVIDDIAVRWNSWDQVTQSSVAKSIAGTRQRENFLVLMNNYQTALQLETESLNSAGLAQERYAIYLESTEAKMAQLQATKDKMWLNFIDSSVIKTGIDLLTGLVGTIDQLINHTESLGVALIGLSTAFIVVYKAMSKITMAKYIEKYAEMTVGTSILTAAQVGLAGVLGTVKTALNLLFTTPLGWITMAVGGVLLLTNHLRKQREELEKLTTTYNDYSNAMSTMDIEGQKKSLNEITEIQKKLNKLMETRKMLESDPYQYETGFAQLTDNQKEIDKLIEQLQDLGFEVDTTTGKIKDLDTITNNINIDEKINSMTKYLDRQMKENENLTALINNYETLSQVENKNEQQKQALNGIVKELKDKYDDLTVSLDKEGNMQITNIGILNDKKTALLAERDALLSGMKDKITALMNETTVVFNNTKTTVGAIRDRIDAYNEEIKVINQRNKAAAGTLSDSRTLELEDSAYKKHRRQNISGAIDYINTVDTKIDDIFSKYTSTSGMYLPSSSSTSKSSASSTSKEEYKAIYDIYQKLNLELDKNNVLLAKNKTLQDLAGDDTAKRIELMEEEIKLNEDRQKLLNTLNNQRRDRARELQKELSDIFNFEGSWDDNSMVITNLSDIEGKGKDIKEKYDEILSIIKDLPGASQDWLNIQNDNRNLILDINKLIEQQRELERTQWIEDQNALYEEQQKRLQSLESIQEKIVQIIRKRGEEEKKALDEAYNKDIEQLDERHNKRKEQYANELDEFRKMIQGKIDALDDQYAEEDYLKALQEERDKATELQKQIDVLSLDTSLTAKNQVAELRKQLADQNAKIADMQQKRERDLIKKSLEDQLKEKEKQVKEIEDIADDQYKNDKKRLEEDYRINKEYLERKYSDEKVYSEARRAILDGEVEVAKGKFVELEDAFEDFEDKFGKGMGILGDIIKNDFTKQLDLARESIEEMDYLAKNLRKQYDSDYQPSDRELGRDTKDKDRSSSGGITMSKSDYDKYVNYKQIYDMAKKDGNKSAMDSAKSGASAIRDKYGITSDKYSYDDLKNKSAKDVRFARGGETAFTGWHYLDGKVGEPERVLSAQQTKDFNKLVGLLDSNSFQSILNNFKVALPKIPSLAGVSGGGNQYQILFDVKGNLDKSIMPDIQRMITATIEKVEFNKEKGFKKIGLTRPV